LGGLILTAIMSLFVSFVQVWQVKKTPYESFIEHVDNCTRFLYNRLNAFENIPQVKSSTSSSTKDSSLEYFHCTKLVSNQAILNGPWVLGMFSHKKLPFLYPSTQDASSAVYEVALALTANGLCLIMEAPEIVKQHLSEGVEHTDKTVQKYLILSPYVISLEYAHFDPEKGSWEFTKSLEQYCKQFAEKGFCQRPNGLRLKFKHDEFEAERFIFIRNDFCEKKAEKDSEKDKKSEKEKEKHDQQK
ncbi:MAG: hypothetical protein ACSW8C_04855, partial [bacterium]